MAVYVLLTIENDQEAKEFVKDVLERGAVSACPLDDEVEFSVDVVAEAKVRGVWKKPTLFCENGPNCAKRSRGFTRGKKYGWWVCVGCGKPSWRWAQGNAWFTALGTNLLPQSQVAPEYRPPGGDPSVLWSFLPGEVLNNVEPHVEWTFKNDPKTGTANITKVDKAE